MPTWVVTGADRGIGYEFLRKLSRRPDNIVFALILNKSDTQAKLVEHRISGVRVFEADVRDREALLDAAKQVQLVTGSAGVDYLISNAGVIPKDTAFRTLRTYLDHLDHFDKDLDDCYRINVVGTLNATAAFIPLLRMGAVKKVIALSSGMGEIEWTNSLDMDMAVPYSMSKAALNMAIAKFNAAYRKEGILFMAVSPGAVDSEDDGRGSNVPIEDVDGDLAQTLYPVRPWHKYLSVAELEIRKQQGEKFHQYEHSYTKPFNTQQSVDALLILIDRCSIEDGYGGAYISHTGTKRWL